MPSVTPNESCVLLITAIIKAAVTDYQNKYLKKHQWPVWNDARRFLFDGKYLEEFLLKFELSKEINCALLRKKARYTKIKTYEYKDSSDGI